MSVKSGDIDTTIFTSNVSVGSTSGGYDFGLVGDVNQSIESITFVLTRDTIGRLILKKKDGTQLIIGATDPSTAQKVVTWKFDWPTDKLKEIILYPSLNMKHLAKVLLVTEKNQFNVSVPSGSVSPTGTRIDVGRGNCVGVFGNAGEHIYNMGFAMLQ